MGLLKITLLEDRIVFDAAALAAAGITVNQFIFVDGANQNAGDGSEANPYQTLAEAIDDINDTESFAIIMAGGVYTEGEHVMQSNWDVEIYGGFEGLSNEDGIGDGWDPGVRPDITLLDGDSSNRIFSMTSSNLTLDQLLLTNGSTTGDGGAIFASSSLLYINNSTVELSSASNGGGIAIVGPNSLLTIQNSVFERNQASLSGGAIYAFDSALVIESSSTGTFFNDNSSVGVDGGGAIFATGSSQVTIFGLDGLEVEFNRNKTLNLDGSGGAIRIKDGANLSLQFVEFTDNVAGDQNNFTSQGRGGAISLENTNINDVNLFIDVTFDSNAAALTGGAINVLDSVLFVYSETTNSEFLSNTVRGVDGGGAIHASGATTSVSIIGTRDQMAVLHTVIFDSNRANSLQGKGGALSFWDGASLDITLADIKNNTADRGGGIYLDNAVSATIIDSLLDMNDAVFAGGAVFVNNSRLDIFSISDLTRITNNRSGAVYATGNSEVSVMGTNAFTTVLFSSNSALNAFGGAIQVLTGSSLEVSYADFVANSALYGGAISIEQNSELNSIQDAIFSGNQATLGGGAIYVKESSLDLQSVGSRLTFLGNSTTGADGGGAIFATGSQTHVTITGTSDDDVLFDSNFVTGLNGRGGAIAVTSDALLDITYAHFRSNTAYLGGAIALDQLFSNAATITDSSFILNDANSGGAIYVSSGDLNVISEQRSTEFISNTSGAIYNGPNSHVTITGNATHSVLFYSNRALSGDGGAIKVAEFAELDVNYGEFLENTATNGGAIIFDTPGFSGFTNTIANSTFTDNIATGSGGALSASYTTIEIIDVKFLGNFTLGGGGAIYVEESVLTIDSLNVGVVFESNTAEGLEGGGALLVEGASSVTLSGTNVFSVTLQSNTATNGSGGAIRSVGGATSLILSNADLSSNNSDGDGGAIWSDSSLSITDSSFIANTTNSGSGGAIFTTGSQLHSTTTNYISNTAQQNGGAIAVDSSTTDFTITDATIFTNQAVQGDGGAIWTQSELTLSVADVSLFNRNTALNGDGGVIWSNNALSVSAALILVFSDNEASRGGVLYSNGTASFLNVGMDSNLSTLDGGALYITAADLTMDNSIISNNQAGGLGGALLMRASSEATLTNVQFTANNSTGTGGAIAVTGASDLTIVGSTFANNTSGSDGGAINADLGSALVVTNTTFEANHSDNRGGALSLRIGSSLTSTGSDFSTNTSDNLGGAIYALSSDLSLDNAYFELNTATNSGGAIYTDGSNATTITNSELIRNTASGFGGGALFLINGATLNITTTDFIFNQSTGTFGGGAIAARTNTSMTIDGVSNFTLNSASTNGGAIAFDMNSILTTVHNPPADNVSFLSNTATGSGGAVWFSVDSTYNSGTTYQQNSAGVNGGAIFSSVNSTLNVTSATITNNTAVQEGGAIYSSESAVVIQQTALDSNSAEVGGAVSSNSSTLTIASNSTLSNNTATIAGGGIAQREGTSTVTSSTISGNSVTGTTALVGQGGALWLQSGAQTTITSSTLENNSASSGGNTIYTYEGSSVNGETETTEIEQALVSASNTVPSDPVEVVDPATIVTVLHVDGSVSVSGDGSSFATAFKTLTEALDTVDSIRQSYITQGVATQDTLLTVLVAEGVYTPGALQSDTFTLMDSHLTIEGGYDALTGMRDVTNYLTILSGEIGTSLVTDNIETILTVTTTNDPNRITLDGFTVTGAYNDSADGNGGGLKSVDGSELTLNNMIFETNSAINSGGAIYVSGGQVMVSFSTFDQNSVTSGNGGAVSMVGGAVVDFDHSTFTNNTASELGEHLFGDTVVLNGQTFEALAIVALNASQNTFVPNDASDPNQIVILSDVNIIFVDGRDAHNHNNRHNGTGTALDPFNNMQDAIDLANATAGFDSIYVAGDRYRDGELVITDDVGILGGFQGLSGGWDLNQRDEVTILDGKNKSRILTVDASTVILDQLTLQKGSTKTDGGAILAQNDSTLIADAVHFLKNKAKGNGGAIQMDGGTLEVTDSSFILNHAKKDGGAIAADQSLSVTLSDANFAFNKGRDGGAVSLVGVDEATVENSYFSFNHASKKGGALYLEDTSATIESNTFGWGNHAKWGDSVYAIDSSINGHPTSTQDALDSLVDENTFHWLKDDDLVIL